MKKVILLISILLLTGLVLIGGSCGESESGDQEKSRMGSCNRIEVEGEGYCVDYIGSGAYSASPCSEQYYSDDPCPPSSIGGCKFHAGTDKEKIIWDYSSSEGGVVYDDYSVEEVLKPSCASRGGIWAGATK